AVCGLQHLPLLPGEKPEEIRDGHRGVKLSAGRAVAFGIDFHAGKSRREKSALDRAAQFRNTRHFRRGDLEPRLRPRIACDIAYAKYAKPEGTDKFLAALHKVKRLARDGRAMRNA